MAYGSKKSEKAMSMKKPMKAGAKKATKTAMGKKSMGKKMK